MKHGHAIPKDKRPAMARRALQIFRRFEVKAEGLRAVADEFDVSEPTARNLVSYGRFLKANPDGEVRWNPNDEDDWEKPRSHGTHLTESEIDQIKQAYIDELMVRDIARELKCSSRVAYKYYSLFRAEGVRQKTDLQKTAQKIGPRYYRSNFEPT